MLLVVVVAHRPAPREDEDPNRAPRSSELLQAYGAFFFFFFFFFVVVVVVVVAH